MVAELQHILYNGTMRAIASCDVHFLISPRLVVRQVSSTTQWNTFRPTDMMAVKANLYELEFPIGCRR